MPIATILVGKGHEVISVTAAQSVREAIGILADRRVGALPVMNGADVAGIFSERDVIHAISAHGTAALDRAVGEVMTAPAITVGPNKPTNSTKTQKTRRRVRHLPVIEDGRVIGVV